MSLGCLKFERCFFCRWRGWEVGASIFFLKKSFQLWCFTCMIWWWFQVFFYFQPYLAKWPNLTNSFLTGLKPPPRLWCRSFFATKLLFSFFEGSIPQLLPFSWSKKGVSSNLDQHSLNNFLHGILWDFYPGSTCSSMESVILSHVCHLFSVKGIPFGKSEKTHDLKTQNKRLGSRFVEWKVPWLEFSFAYPIPYHGTVIFTCTYV